MAGDILLLNTRLWFHRTELPPTRLGARDGLSMSYARDFHFTGGKAFHFVTPDMSNRTGPVATRTMGAGEVLLREEPLFSVQSPVQRALFPCCEQCRGQVGSLEDAVRALLGPGNRGSKLVIPPLGDGDAPWMTTPVFRAPDGGVELYCRYTPGVQVRWVR